MAQLDDPTAQDPNSQEGGDANWQQCEQEIEQLKERMKAVEAAVGIQSPDDEPDDLQQSIQNTKPFGPMSGMSNS